MIKPCLCKGTTAFVHKECLLKWLDVSNSKKCEICHFEFRYKQNVHVSCPHSDGIFARDVPTRRMITVLGIVFCFFTQIVGMVFPDMLFAAYVCTNITLFCFVVLSQCFCNDFHIIETVAYWKWCTFFSLLCLTFMFGDILYTKIDAAIATVLTIFAYFQLLKKAKTRIVEEILLPHPI